MNGTDQNKLGGEKSPYLLQHKDNPVWWQPWGEQAFAAARSADKPIFLSIGYSTCYWCHVMEKDSFEHQDVADLLNRDFVSIKVDREERPDIDQIYMDAVVGLTGRGGWPMSVFLTPDRKPFFGGTFFYREQFKKLLAALANAWKEDRERVLSSANSIVDALRERSVEASGEPPSDRMLELALREYSRVFDEQEGGFGSAPKFPQSLQISLLLRVLRRLAEPEEQKLARRMIELTLFKMARGGIYDQIGGGFHRYSTDERWLVPHFEKMLYDNALLSVTYLEAYQLLKDNFYRQIGLETLDYMQQEMQSPEGGFYSAEDAGEVGLEGEFYVWSFEQLKSELSLDELKLAERYFGVTPQGNFEHGKNILVFDWGVPVETRAGQEFGALRKKLLEIRGKRQRPHRDEKILCGWNGLALSAFAKGYQIGGEERYLNAAQRCAEFLERIFVTEQGLKRRYFQGSVGIEATHEDYAFFIDGLIELYQSNFDLHWLELAIKLQDRQDAVFWDTNSPGYNFSVSEDAIIKKKDFLDNATPSANSVSLLNLIKLHGLAGEKRHYQRSRELAGLLSGLAHKYPLGFPKALSAFDYILEGGKEIIVVNPRGGSAGYEFVRKIQADFNPNQVVALCEPIAIEAQTALKPAAGRTLEAGRTTVYVCREHVCSAPTVNLEEAAAMCSEIRRME